MQAVIIASICEFLGAVLLGASVTDTIKSGIAKTAYFRTTPELLMFGMFCVSPDRFFSTMRPVTMATFKKQQLQKQVLILRGSSIWFTNQCCFCIPNSPLVWLMITTPFTIPKFCITDWLVMFFQVMCTSAVWGEPSIIPQFFALLTSPSANSFVIVVRSSVPSIDHWWRCLLVSGQPCSIQ